MKLSGACFHLDTEVLFQLTASNYEQLGLLYADHGMTLVQMGIAFNHCLFDSDRIVRQKVLEIICRGIQAARRFGADVVLIRTGSLKPAGSYVSSRNNHEPEQMRLLIAMLRQTPTRAETAGQTIVIETHVLRIMNFPELIVEVIR